MYHLSLSMFCCIDEHSGISNFERYNFTRKLTLELFKYIPPAEKTLNLWRGRERRLYAPEIARNRTISLLMEGLWMAVGLIYIVLDRCEQSNP